MKTDEIKIKEVELMLDGKVRSCAFTQRYQDKHNEPSNVIIEYIDTMDISDLDPCHYMNPSKKHLDFYLTFEDTDGRKYWKVLE